MLLTSMFMEKINRRQFMFSLLALSKGSTNDEEMRRNVLSSKSLKLENILKINSMPSLIGNDFSIHYNLFEDSSLSPLGKASVKYNYDENILDFGIDDFSFWTDSLLWILSPFSGKYEKISDLQKVRCFSEFRKNKGWIMYGENIPKREKTSLEPHYYERLENKVIIDGTKTLLEGKNVSKVHNPASVLLDVLGGNQVKEFKILTAGKFSDVIASYKQEKEMVSAEVDFPFPVIGSFRKVYAVLCKGIPVAGYISQDSEDGKEVKYIRGELDKININGKIISI